MGQNHQSHLCCCLDNTSPGLAITSTSTAASRCSMHRPKELVPVSPCSCPSRGSSSFTRKSTAPPRSYLPSATFDFHSEVTSPLKNVLASALLTFTQKSLHLSRPCLQCLPLWHRFLLWCSHPALGCLILPSGATHPAVQDAHCRLDFTRGAVSGQMLPQGSTHPTGQGRTLLFSILFARSCSTELVFATRCHLIKINLILFPVTVLRSLSFLIPSFTKITMSSNPVVHLPLTYA